jgi:hypothetical protein
MGLITAVVVILVALAVIGGGATTFFDSVSKGADKISAFVESSPALKNITQETQEFATEQAGKVVQEVL